jgi:hypothetical protein
MREHQAKGRVKSWSLLLASILSQYEANMKVNKPTETQPGYPSGSLVEQRVNFILYEISQGRGELTDEVIAELAELDGSDTSVQTQLFDAGFGPGGIY